ncbi:hypothetical protein [Natronococcus roseus]|uniref:hypothetical protein n=1 Tax=Natronococcus roseus TaxID=1052014 RepID=UPI00374D5237
MQDALLAATDLVLVGILAEVDVVLWAVVLVAGAVSHADHRRVVRSSGRSHPRDALEPDERSPCTRRTREAQA